MNTPPNLNRLIKTLTGIDDELGFVEQVQETARRINDFILREYLPSHEAGGKQGMPESPLQLVVQYDYPFLSMTQSERMPADKAAAAESCILLANHQLQLVWRESEKAQRNVHEFLHPLSHYMKSPLTAILGYSSLLEDELGGNQDEEIFHYIRRIGENTKLLVKMIDDLLYLSNLTREEEEELSVSNLVSQAMDTLSINTLKQTGGDRNPTIHIQEGLPSLLMNRQHAVTLFVQLLSNACTHTDRDPTIEIGYREHEFFIQDRGKGISQDNLLKVFRIFFTTCSKETGCTGAGLYIVKKILELYGGSIRIESSVGRGTTVYFKMKTVV